MAISLSICMLLCTIHFWRPVLSLLVLCLLENLFIHRFHFRFLCNTILPDFRCMHPSPLLLIDDIPSISHFTLSSSSSCRVSSLPIDRILHVAMWSFLFLWLFLMDVYLLPPLESSRHIYLPVWHSGFLFLF